MRLINEQLAELLARALTNERRAIRVDELLAAAAGSRRERELLQAIRREERRHYYLLEGIYEDMTGEEYHGGRLSLSLPRRYDDMLKAAMADKLAAVDFYSELIGQIGCVRNKQFVETILCDQKEHIRLLAALYDRKI